MNVKIFTNEAEQLELWISPKNPEERDFIEMPRFQLMRGLGSGKTILTVSEDWDVIQDKIEEASE